MHLHTKDIKMMLEYVQEAMVECRTVNECHEVIQRAIELCGAHNIEQLRQEFGII